MQVSEFPAAHEALASALLDRLQSQASASGQRALHAREKQQAHESENEAVVAAALCKRLKATRSRNCRANRNGGDMAAGMVDEALVLRLRRANRPPLKNLVESPAKDAGGHSEAVQSAVAIAELDFVLRTTRALQADAARARFAAAGGEDMLALAPEQGSIYHIGEAARAARAAGAALCALALPASCGRDAYLMDVDLIRA